MIENDAQLDQAREALGQLERAVQALHARFGREKKALFAAMAEDYRTNILRIRTEIDAYLGLDAARSHQARCRLESATPVLKPLPEKAVQSQVIDLFKKVGCHVYSTSQYRASHIAVGFPDLKVFCPVGSGAATWFECKARDAKGRLKPLRPAQAAFRAIATASGEDYDWGDLEIAKQVLVRWGLADGEGLTYRLRPLEVRQK